MELNIATSSLFLPVIRILGRDRDSVILSSAFLIIQGLLLVNLKKKVYKKRGAELPIYLVDSVQADYFTLPCYKCHNHCNRHNRCG